MAIVAAIWGTWHIVSGLLVAIYWSRHTPKSSNLTISLSTDLNIAKNNQ